MLIFEKTEFEFTFNPRTVRGTNIRASDHRLNTKRQAYSPEMQPVGGLGMADQGGLGRDIIIGFWALLR
jgi:hypothetical protein